MQSHSHRSLLGLAALVMAVLAGGWYFEARHRQSDAQAFEARLARLERRGAASDVVPAPSRAGVQVVSAESLAGIAPGGPAARLGPQTAEDAQRQATEAFARLDARFATDGNDAAWAMSTEGAVNRAIAEPALAPFKAPQASDIRCARTMCRLEFTFASLDQAEDWLTYYPLGVASQLPIFRSQSLLLPDGRVQLNMFGFRDANARL